jgi:hypothetical protein
LNGINTEFDNVKNLFLHAFVALARVKNPNATISEDTEKECSEHMPKPEELVFMMEDVGVHMNRLLASEALVAACKSNSGKYSFEAIIRWICSRLPEMRPVGNHGNNFGGRMRRVKANESVL